MSIEMWLAFVVASLALLSIPGPTVLLVVSYVLGRGRATGWATVPGVVLGDFAAMTASLLGAGALLAASANLFAAVKLAGAFYLVWLGIKLWRSGGTDNRLTRSAPAAPSGRSMFWNSFAVTALNPKSIMFFVAFLPQFVDPGGPVVMQFLILEATFLVLAGASIAVWALAAGQLQRRLRNPRIQLAVNRIGAGFLISAGLLTATLQRNN